jgi:arylsulfatase
MENIALVKFAVLNIVLFTLAVLLQSCKAGEEQNINEKPNIVYILADDLGYGDLGCYGQEKIETPNIDALAEQGMRFTQHYSGAPVCAPARCVLMTGKHTGHAYIRGNHEWGERGDVWSYEKMIEDSGLEGQWPIPDSILTIAEVLKTGGYSTACVGKWGLGAPLSEGDPTNQGFDLFYGYNCQRQAHTYYPAHLWRNKERHWLGNKIVAPHKSLSEDQDPEDMTSYADFNLDVYSPDMMLTESLNFIEQQSQGPFFLYFASPIPHLPLQAPQKWIDFYVEKFGDEVPYIGDRGYYPHRYPHAAYAAMVSCLDEQVGEIVRKLKETGVYENTLIIFTSDNGPTYTGGADSEYFDSARPFRSDEGRGKGNVYEGGIRVPMIASWHGRIEPGSVSDHISAFWDVFPTLCDVTSISIPEEIDGISMLPEFLGDKNQTRHKYLYWEFPAYGGQQAIRKENWKAVRRDLFKDSLNIALYDLASDPLESRDISDERPEIVEELRIILNEAHTKAEVERFKIRALGDD